MRYGHRRWREPTIPLSPRWWDGTGNAPVFILAALATVVALVVLHLSRTTVTTRCARRWFEDTNTLGGMTVDYEETSCEMTDETTVGCTVPIEAADFPPAYVECAVVYETLFRDCDCNVPGEE